MNDKIKTVDISKISPDEFVEMIQFESYCLHRQRGLTHEQLVKIGFPNSYKQKYNTNTEV